VPGGLTTEMRARLEALGFRPSRRLGQNFMRDGNMIAALARASGAAAGDLVLEPGPGAGGLTAELLALGCTVAAVEIDPLLAAFMRERFAGEPRLALVEGDVLAGGRRLSPAVLAALGDRPFRVCSNLPYSAGTPFLVALAASDLPWKCAAVTVQKEVAERLSASPGDEQYGAATVLVGVRAGCRLERRVPPEVFWPRPQVDSAVACLEPLERPAVSAPEFDRFAAFVRALFSFRRKRLERALVSAGLAAEAARAAAGASGAREGDRPENVAPAGFAAMWRRSLEP
jgi:16S rRNA (adenine1518-N6/adenine1519-N6)-dimethyltransferase